MTKRSHILFYIIILIEGFFTLSLELLVIRQLVPFVGNGTEVVAIIISSVLLPLAIGYYYGGIRYRENFKKYKNTKIRNILINNIYKIAIITGVGFSIFLLEVYFTLAGSSNTLISLSMYLLFFLSFPAFLLGQTVPLVSNYFGSEKISSITGRILFISTAGSFLGSMITVLILMRFIGVSNTLIVIVSLLTILTILISKRKKKDAMISLIIVFLVASSNILSKDYFHVEYENNYNTVSILEDDTNRQLRINRSSSSITNKNNSVFFAYVNVINGMLRKIKNKNILVIGAGGFTIGFNNKDNNYTYIDVDEELKKISENKFLKQKLKANKKFYATEARKFLHNHKEKFDIIIIDAYTNIISVPSSLLSADFYKLLKTRLNTNGTVIANIIADVYNKSEYSRNIDTTLRVSFDTTTVINVQNVNTGLELYSEKSTWINKLYVMQDKKYKKIIYTDDINNASFDLRR